MSQQVEALRRILEAPHPLPSYTINEFAEIEKCSRRQVELLIEAGELAAYREGKRWRIPHAAREDLIRRRIKARIQELEAMAE